MAVQYAVIPAYEPDTRLIGLAEALRRQGFEVVTVDDGSGRACADIFQEAGKYAHVITLPVNQGKGRALKAAYAWLRGRVRDGDTVVTLDCDGQHSVEDAAALCGAAQREAGTLFLGSRKQTAASPLRSRLGNAVTRKVFQFATGLAVYDTQTGLRAFSAQFLPAMLEIPGERYEYEMNVLLTCARQGIPVRELPIETIYIDGNAGSHFHPLRDSWLVYREVLKFSCSSLLAFLTDYSLYSLLVLLGAVPLCANIAARCVSASVNFTINRRFVFRDGSPLLDSAVRYAALALGILLCNSLILCLLAGFLNPWLAKLLTEILLFLFSYLAQKRLVFAKKIRLEV